jgi:phosphoenolpyruvate synthase/pyruvate phosphate dikinase
MVDIEVRGLPASPGRARGRARVLRDLEGLSTVGAGDILVTRFAVPEVVIVFERIHGLVTDHGGRLAHASVVAREVGIPAVVGTLDATALIPDGSIVELDGTSGVVRVVPAALRND